MIKLFRKTIGINQNKKKSFFEYSISQSQTLKILVILFLSSNSLLSQVKKTQETTSIPEPLMFDLIRGLGAKQGELEINSLFDIPLDNFHNRGVEWAPEIEYALFDGLAVELEFPFENYDLEAYKMAIQWTMGTSKNNKFIHGIQFISESYIHDDILELSLLYIPAYRFNEIWSAIGLFGVMIESGSDAPEKKNTVLLNASVFANLSKHTIVGIEINNSDPTIQKIDSNNMELLVLPQLHYEFDSGFSFQFSVGPKFLQNETNLSAVFRAIKEF